MKIPEEIDKGIRKKITNNKLFYITERITAMSFAVTTKTTKGLIETMKYDLKSDIKCKPAFKKIGKKPLTY